MLLLMRCLCLLSLLGLGQAKAQMILEQDPNPIQNSYGALFAQIVVHESGHGIMGALAGWELEAFRPFPHFCRGKFVGGCVIFSKGGKYPIAVKAAGSMLNLLLGVVATESLASASTPSDRAFVYHYSQFALLDFPFYAVIDAITGFNGDWYSITKRLDISRLWLLPAALAYIAIVMPYWSGKVDSVEKNLVANSKAGSLSNSGLPNLQTMPLWKSGSSSLGLGVHSDLGKVIGSAGVKIEF